MPFRHLVKGSNSLTEKDVLRLGELVAEWQLLADISFADLVLWIPRRQDDKSWPEGHIAIAQIRPMTAATVFSQDLIGNEVMWGKRPHIRNQKNLANFSLKKRQFQFTSTEESSL
jgi:hypothetical protein